MWKSELNIDIALENQEWKVFQDTMNKIDFDICRYGWIGDYMDPVTFLNIWTTGNGNNNTHWSNPEYDQLISLAARTGDPQARFDILHRAEDLFLNEPPIVLLYWYTNFYLLQPSVKNWYPLALDNHNYKFIDLEASPEGTK
jgi:oligopeptide transport system substrate-binding protein